MITKRDKVLLELLLDYSVVIITGALVYQYQDLSIALTVITSFIAGYLMKKHKFIEVDSDT